MAVRHSELAGTVIEQVVTVAHAAATATDVVASWQAPYNIKLHSVTWRPSAAITGVDTNSSNVNLLNAGTDGDGTTELGNVDYASGTDAASGEEVSLYAPSSPVAYSEGNLFKLQVEKVGNGLAIPSGVLVFTFSGNGD